MAIGQDIGMGTAYGGGITGLNTGINLAATGLQAPTWQETIRERSTRPYVGVNPESPQFAPSRRIQDLNQLYKTAMDAFTRTGRGTWGTDMPEQYKNWAMTTGVPSAGITTLPAATNRTEPLAQLGRFTEGTPEYDRVAKGLSPYPEEPTYPTQDEFLQQKQAAWRAQNPDPAMMPAFQIIGTDLPASQAAGYDVPLWGEGQSVGPEGMPYMPTLDQLAQMDAIKLKIDAGTATQEDIDLFNQLNFGRPLLPGEQGVFAGGGIVGLNYLTRGL